MTLQYLDIAIAVAVVMLAVSLLITILVQLVTAVLGLRGSNLRWAIATLIHQIHPEVASDRIGFRHSVGVGVRIQG